MTIFNFQSTDISLSSAIDSHRMTSFSPEKRGHQVVKEYVDHMQSVNDEFQKWLTEENESTMAADLERYRIGYIKRRNAHISAHGRCVSQMITGAGGWTPAMVRKNQKANGIEHKRLTELIKYSDKILEILRRKYNPYLISKAPISSADPDAIELLEEKIAKAEEKQEFMKKVNRIVRSKKKTDEQKIAALIEMDVKEDTAKRFLANVDYRGNPGFERYELTNNNANIRRMKQRVSVLKREEKSREAVGGESVDVKCGQGITLREDFEEERIMIVFPDKPDPDTRSKLKRRGFRWSPRNGAWQRLLNDNGRYAAKEVLSEIGLEKIGA